MLPDVVIKFLTKRKMNDPKVRTTLYIEVHVSSQKILHVSRYAFQYQS